MLLDMSTAPPPVALTVPNSVTNSGSAAAARSSSAR
jgi:hypothetical protein